MNFRLPETEIGVVPFSYCITQVDNAGFRFKRYAQTVSKVDMLLLGCIG